MSEALERLSVEQTENHHVITIRQSAGKDFLKSILFSGILWLVVVIIWKTSTFSVSLIFSLLSMLFQICLILFIAFGKNTLEINSNEIIIKRIETDWFPRWRTIHLKADEIESAFYVFQGTWLGDRRYDINIQLKSGRVVNVAWKINLENDLEAAAIVERIYDSYNRFLLPPSER